MAASVARLARRDIEVAVRQRGPRQQQMPAREDTGIGRSSRFRRVRRERADAVDRMTRRICCKARARLRHEETPVVKRGQYNALTSEANMLLTNQASGPFATSKTHRYGDCSPDRISIRTDRPTCIGCSSPQFRQCRQQLLEQHMSQRPIGVTLLSRERCERRACTCALATCRRLAR